MLKMGNAASNDPWTRTYQNIKNAHDLAYATIEQAISLEEQEKPNDAIEKYKEGILEIDKALNIQVSCPENPDFTWEKARSMIHKMKKSRAEVLMRINSIQNLPEFIPSEPPPSYEEAVANTPPPDGVPRTYNELASALTHLDVKSEKNNNENKTDVLYSYDNVMLYFITPNGQVTSTSQPYTLYIFAVEDAKDTEPRAYLQIGEWVYPLVPGVSPCYRTDYGAFILPDVHSDIPGASIGIILPSGADAAVYELLESILHGIVRQKRESDERGIHMPEELTANVISNKIVNGAWYISQGLVRGAQKVEDLMNNGTPKIINNISPANQATPIPRKLSKGMKIAENATNKAANVTGFVADKVGLATVKLGQFLAPHIEKQGTRLLTSQFKYSEQEASTKMKGILTVAAGAVEGFSTVYRGLENSASILGNGLKNNTVKVVQHKYGYPAGEVTQDTFNTVGNVWSVNNNIRHLTPKGLAKKTAKSTVNGFTPYQRNVLPPTNSIDKPSTSKSSE